MHDVSVHIILLHFFKDVSLQQAWSVGSFCKADLLCFFPSWISVKYILRWMHIRNMAKISKHEVSVCTCNPGHFIIQALNTQFLTLLLFAIGSQSEERWLKGRTAIKWLISDRKNWRAASRPSLRKNVNYFELWIMQSYSSKVKHKNTELEISIIGPL